MNNNIKVSIIVPIYKTQKYLMQCIESIKSQTLRDIEIILVDEGDEDECYAIMLREQSKDKRIRIIHEKNGGYGAAANKAISIAQGDYIGFVESDDFIELNMYEELCKFADANDVEFVKCTFYNYFDATKQTPEKKERYGLADWLANKLPRKAFSPIEHPVVFCCHPSLWAGIYKSSFLKHPSLAFVEAPGASYVDHNFRLMTIINAKRIGYIDKALYNYRVTNENASSFGGKFNLSILAQRWDEIHSYFQKNSDLYNSLAPFLIQEEFLTLFAPFYHNPDDKEIYKIIHKNYKCIPEGALERAPISPCFDKGSIYYVKLYANESLDDFIAEARGATNQSRENFLDLFARKMSLLQSQIIINLTTVDIHLLKNIKLTFLNFNMRFLKYFELLLTIGKR